MTKDILDKLAKDRNVIQVAPFGSRVVGCSDEGSDWDYLVLVKLRPDTFWMDRVCPGFLPDANGPMYGPDFSSWRKDDVNLVFTEDRGFFKQGVEATKFCRKYKIYDKADRCKVHESFRDAVKFKSTLERDFSFD